jgi:hypothetical protein
MRIIEKKIVTFDELNDEQKSKAIELNFSDGWIYEYCLHERIDTLKEYAKFIGGKLDYSISCVPDRGEFITIKDFDQVKFRQSFKLKDCALTGVCYDDDLIDFLNKFGSLDMALRAYIDDIHDEYESMLKIDSIGELCESNNYEFYLDTLKMY